MTVQTLHIGGRQVELDLLTKEDIESVLDERVSGWLRPPNRTRIPGGVRLDGSGNGTITAYTVEPGMEFILTRAEFRVNGTTGGSAATPFNPASAGGIDILVNGDWRDGYAFGGSPSAGSLPAVWTENPDRTIVLYGGDILTYKIVGGPASLGFVANTIGLLKASSPFPAFV